MSSNKAGSSSGINERKYPPLPASPRPDSLEDAFLEDEELKIANAVNIIQSQGNKYDPPITVANMPFTLNDPHGKKWAARWGMSPPSHTTAPPPLPGVPYPKRRIGQSIVNATVMAKKSIMNKERNAAAAGGGGGFSVGRFIGLSSGGTKRRRHKKHATRRRRRHHKK